MPDAHAYTVFHPTHDSESFDSWLHEVAASAETEPGFVESHVSVHDGRRLEWAVSAVFSSEQQLHDWLDGVRADLLEDGTTRGFYRKSSDVIVVVGANPPAGVSVFQHSVAAGKEKEFIAAQVVLIEKTAVFPGYEGTIVFPAHGNGEWLSVLRFRTAQQLRAWLQSKERAAALPNLRAHLTEDFKEASHTTPFGSTVRFQNGETLITPKWKSAMIVLLVLYPTVMVLSRFLGPQLDRMGAAPGLALWFSQICSVGLMTYFFIPPVSKWFSKWLDPIDGAGLRTSIVGAFIVSAVYVATLALFLSVQWLQFWDYNK
ncbi:antibiotic biosynthesis monooxygenase [Antrihabitans sp. YC2-6]|uniref:antibiotic biosynthesis monooxygenase n=1 Tax=Antrihabitans sp. YC2-6 TaxID=2799498 RepID=UPI0018F618C8|nr:antibiotic biosynthesis monooxygenase [Antrihabitans sp. YC2-6]MBJ8348933.1 antibiotic biosynthesis monooxygenase [Antrihabitans sp. YC2-6]